MRIVAGKRYFGVGAEDYEEARQFRKIISELIDFQGVEKRMIRLQKISDELFQCFVDQRRNDEEGHIKTMIDVMLALSGFRTRDLF
ncbi:hypothetical protein RJ639_005889 [Escallonia herrerae]|uniref:Uncharacterized protein n=1 Tax=Escallonia herrerae TaxID=1293975 RepID=A0AA89AU14_9ASTE|nr:hypothetical protein RJ639_005889 [Escallonia herrerae]